MFQYNRKTFMNYDKHETNNSYNRTEKTFELLPQM